MSSGTRMSRRTTLRGFAAALVLPLLDAMVPPFSSVIRGAGAAARRLAVVYLPNGMAMPYWTPKTDGPLIELTPVLQPLAAFRNRLIVVSGLTQRPSTKPAYGNH